jgi:putative phage-type endonuclease
MLEAFVEQRSQEWHDRRAQLITASEAAYALGISKYKTVDEYVHDKVVALSGGEPSFKGNKFTRWGTDKEDYVKGRLEHDANVFIAECELTVHPQHEWLGASPDGRISNDIGVEIKCPYADVFASWSEGQALSDEVRAKSEERIFTAADKPDYWIQMQIQMACCGFKQVLFCVWTPSIMHTEYVDRDDAWLEENLPKLKQVHDRIHAEFNDPEVRARHLIGTQDQTDDLEIRHLSEQYSAVYQHIKSLQENLDLIKTKIIERMQETSQESSETHCLKIRRSIKKGRLNSTELQKAAIQKGIDVDQFRGEEEESWTVTVKKNRE